MNRASGWNSYPSSWFDSLHSFCVSMFVSQNLRFTATIPEDEEFAHPAGATLIRLLFTELTANGWGADELENWRDCGWSLACRRNANELEVVVSALSGDGDSWMLQVAPLRAPGLFGRLSGAKRSAEASEVLALAQAVHRVLADSGNLANPQWCRDGFPEDGQSTPEPH